jgi:membrane protein DedA with SNARE-associated domain
MDPLSNLSDSAGVQIQNIRLPNCRTPRGAVDEVDWNPLRMDFFNHYGLLAVFVSLVSTPLGNPVPEDLSLLAGGMMAGTGQTSIWNALIVGYTGVVLGDCIAWAMGRRVGLEPNGFLSRIAGRKQVARLNRFYQRFGDRTILICRQFPGFRLPCFFIAGASGMSIKRFLLIDGSAALITTNVFTWLGYHYAEDLVNVITWLERFRQGVLVLAVFVGALVVYRIVQYQVERKKVSSEE